MSQAHTSQQNLKGRAAAFTTLTPNRDSSRLMRFVRRVVLRASLVVVRFDSLRQQEAVDLAFLHFARWIIIVGRQFGLRRDYVLFCSSFNGDWDDYLNAFGRVLHTALNRIWGSSEGWPGAERLAAFKRYVARYELRPEAFFNAYGAAGARDIRSALVVSEALDDFADRARDLEPGALRAAYDELLVELSPHLASTKN